jgi:hypothetical protein
MVQAAILAATGDVAGARAIVSRTAGPVAVIEVNRRHQAPRVTHRTTDTLTEIFPAPHRACPRCGEPAVCMLPPGFAGQQTDGTNAVCHPAHGGCNQGFHIPTRSTR